MYDIAKSSETAFTTVSSLSWQTVVLPGERDMWQDLEVDQFKFWTSERTSQHPVQVEEEERKTSLPYAVSLPSGCTCTSA
jgi:hypothetical protein